MDLNYKTYGEGYPLVILHGLFGSLDNWSTLARRWAKRYRVILVDLPNHGRSPHTDEITYPQLAHDLAAFLEGIGVDACYLLGHSMGGKVAMQTALTYPGLVEKLVVVDMAPRQYGRGHDDVFAALRALDPSSLEDRRDADAAMEPYLQEKGVRQFLLKNLARDDEGFRWRMNLEVLDNDYENLIASVGTLGQTYPKPALFLRGSKSGYVKEEDLDGILRHFPQAQLTTIQGAGHWVHAEQPEELYTRVAEFLS
ncbi:alpha/beta fold hydrolase [Lewinella sp. IMCC34183]|uniref:alpha/beta fold hydrolase n=1 Tax=Lewinella sp. IMCC34183 TaxID=2248762 RepID=UPI000E287A50|nr:alpha/beta fold hydrolase [Lewinella sp. IMCC34183]